jgi:pimeloyl-ACP methyl ester carboxylesterase
MELNVSKLREEFKDPHYLINPDDNTTLFLRAWEPSSNLKNIAILIFHGITAYSGPYELIAKPLSNSGYSVFGLDLRGHGLSDGNRGDYPNRECLIKDLCTTISFLKNKFPTLTLLGHSLGVMSSIVAVNNCIENIDGLILLSAGREARPGVYTPLSILDKLKIVFSSLISPSKPVISYYREGMTGLDDPLYNFKYTLRFMRIFNPKKLEIPEKLDIPVIVGVGDQDEIFTVESAKNLLNEIQGDNKEFFVMKNGKHAEFPKDSFKPLISWLEKNFQ